MKRKASVDAQSSNHRMIDRGAVNLSFPIFSLPVALVPDRIVAAEFTEVVY